MTAPRRTLAATAVLAVLAPLAAAGCGVLPGADRCGGQQPRLTALRQLEELALAPAGSQPVDGPEPDAECVDGDGENMLTAGLTYGYPDTMAPVHAYYAAELPARGWTPRRTEVVGDSCYGRETAAGATLLRISGPKLGRPNGRYLLTAEAAIEGEPSCA
ncbi:hypothetical protein ACFVZ3_23615 [Kitasatospora purpeofusca]|uniref:hypothetical protein n=1 Tax=Kitasatospora purpeofusca TaxID=67352 RepID=UPI0036ABB61B